MTVVDAQEATRTYDCRFPSCTNTSRSSRGPYSYCDDHRGMTPAAENGPRPVRDEPVEEATTEQKVRSLAAAARDVDKAFAKADRLRIQAAAALTTAKRLKREFETQAAKLLGSTG